MADHYNKSKKAITLRMVGKVLQDLKAGWRPGLHAIPDLVPPPTSDPIASASTGEGDGEDSIIHRFSDRMSCPDHPQCNLDELEPRLFSFNSPAGAAAARGGGVAGAGTAGVLRAWDDGVSTELPHLRSRTLIPHSPTWGRVMSVCSVVL